MKRLHYQDRMTFCKNPLAKQLLHLISEKKSNLALSADVTRCAEIIELAEKIGPEICVLKTHIDILEDFTIDFIQELTNLAKKQQFLIFEDRKFADIGNTVKLKYAKGIYLTPGVQFSQHNDSYGQQYITPEQAIIQNETDIIIVGRGIISAKDPAM